MKAATMFSGIGAPETAAPFIDWIWCAEIEPFPAAVMAIRHPNTVNLGDVTAPEFIERAKGMGHIDLLVAGPPCQAFSVAGLRNSLSDERGNLSLVYARAIDALDPEWIVTENVPGWLSTKDNAFGHFLSAVVGGDAPLVPPTECGWTDSGVVVGPKRAAAWTILDAQYFGLAQRRRRVFIVIERSGDGTGSSKVLFERESLRGDSPPSREKGERVAPTVAVGPPFSRTGTDRVEAEAMIPILEANKRCGSGPCGDGIGKEGDPMYTLQSGAQHAVACPLTSKPYGDHESREGLLIAHSLRADGFDASEDGTGRGVPLAVTYSGDRDKTKLGLSEVNPALNANPMSDRLPLVMAHGQGNAEITEDIGTTLNCNHEAPIIFDPNQVTSPGNYSNPKAVAFPIDMRNAMRDPEKLNEMNRQGCGLGDEGEPDPTVSVAHVNAVAQAQWASGGGQVENPTAQSLRSGAEHNYQFLRIESPADVNMVDSLEWKEYTSLQGGPYNGPEEGTRSREVLRILCGKVGEEVFEEWGLGVLASLSEAGLLQQEVHGEGLRFAPVPKHGIFNKPFPFEKTCTYGEMRTVWRRECLRRTSQKWKLEGQLRDELGAYLSQLSFEGTPQAKALHYLRETSEGFRLLQQTLDTFQEIWRPERLQDSAKEEMQTLRRSCEREGSVRKALHAGEKKGGLGVMSVRRLTPL
jgi:hypothetical protein